MTNSLDATKKMILAILKIGIPLSIAAYTSPPHGVLLFLIVGLPYLLNYHYSLVEEIIDHRLANEEVTAVASQEVTQTNERASTPATQTGGDSPVTEREEVSDSGKENQQDGDNQYIGEGVSADDIPGAIARWVREKFS